MKYIIVTLFTFSLLVLSSFSYKQEVVPDPELFAKTFLETIKKNSKEEYLKIFSVTSKDIQWLSDQIVNDIYTSEEAKAEWIRKLGDTSETINDLNQQISEGYDEIVHWVQSENINLSELEFVRIYYAIEYEHRSQLQILEKAILFLKYKEKYYAISIRDAVYFNGKWKFGRVRDISEADKYFEDVEGGYGNERYSEESYVSPTDTTAAAPEEYYAVDTTAYVEYEEPILNKKQQKIQKKIDAQRAELMKLYEEMYNAE